MAGDTPPRATTTPVTVLFADITSSVMLYAQRGDAAAFALATACLDLIDRHVVAAGGRVLRRLGDGVLALFDTSEAALGAATNVRAALEEPASTLAAEGMRVRCGIASGAAVVVPGDVYGDVVNVAARLVHLAFVDEILLSGGAYEGLPRALRAQAHMIDQLALRNRPTPVVVYEFTRGEQDTTVSAAVRMRGATTTMEITHGERLLVVGPERPRVTIGRDARSDIRVAQNQVSRAHAVISLRGDKFVLADHSINGTYVYLAGGSMLRILREEIVLTGSGRIVPGVESPQPIIYSVIPSGGQGFASLAGRTGV